MENKFNLIDEPWIPVADAERVSLSEIFSNRELRSLGGSPIQKIAVHKLLQAIAQASCTPKDDDDWIAISESELANNCLAYLQKWHDRFYLYGDRPFLQIPAIEKAEVKSFGAVMPEVSTGNTTVISQIQKERCLDDSDKALLLLTLMGFALGGKKTDNSVILTSGYTGKLNEKLKPSTSKAGPSMGFMGLLHNFVLGEDLLKTVRLNLFSHQDIADSALYPGGVGTPPWENMPVGEDCTVAQAHKTSLQGRLIPLARFCLLTEKGLHYSEGIAHPDYKVGGIDPTIAIDARGKDPKVLWANPEKRPWRELTALMGFMSEEKGSFTCLQLRSALRRATQTYSSFAVWSGGLRVSSNAGEQYVSGSDDYVESTTWLHSDALGARWFSRLKLEMDDLNDIAKNLYGCVMGFYKAQLVDGKSVAAQGTGLFWQLCERDAQNLFDACGDGIDNDAKRQALRQKMAANAHTAFNQFCPSDTARQIDAWAKSRPNMYKYLHQEMEKV